MKVLWHERKEGRIDWRMDEYLYGYKTEHTHTHTHTLTHTHTHTHTHTVFEQIKEFILALLIKYV